MNRSRKMFLRLYVEQSTTDDELRYRFALAGRCEARPTHEPALVPDCALGIAVESPQERSDEDLQRIARHPFFAPQWQKKGETPHDLKLQEGNHVQ